MTRDEIIKRAKEIDPDGFSHKVANRELDCGEAPQGADIELTVAEQIVGGTEVGR